MSDLSGIVPKQGLSAAQTAGLLASIMMGAKLFGGDDPIISLPGTPTQRTMALMGLAGLAGFFSGRKKGQEITRMPITDQRLRQQMPANVGFRNALSAPLAFNMLFGKTAGALTQSLRNSEEAMKMAADRLNAMQGESHSETLPSKLGHMTAQDYVDVYGDSVLDSLIMGRFMRDKK